MAKKNEVVKDLYEKINKGVTEVFSSEQYRNFLKFCSSFYRYSAGNQMLIYMQMRTASKVAGFHSWKKMGRKIKKGSMAIKILAPLIKKFEDENGNEEKRLYGFRYVNVFDISQTEGEDIPSPCKVLDGDSEEARQIYESLLKVIKIPVAEEGTQEMGMANGYYNPMEDRIAVKAGLANDQKAKTLIHEYAHSLLHKDTDKDRRTAEVEAESVAFIVSNYFGLDTSQYSFGYVATWSKSKELDELKESAETIQSQAKLIIDEIEKAQGKMEEVA